MMPMRTVVLEAYETEFLARLITAFLVLFVSVIVLILLTLVSDGASREAFIGVSMYLAFALIVIGLMMFCLGKMREAPKRAAMLAEACTFEGARLVFPDELEFEYGRITLHRSEKRRSAKKFQVLKRGKSSTLKFPRGEFKLCAAIGKGFASFPAVRVLTHPYDGAVVLFMTQEGRVVGKRLLTASTSGGYVDVEIEGRGKSLLGRFYTPPGQRGKVEILLSAPESPEVSIKIADSSMGEFEYPLLPEESTVIFCPYGSLSVDNILKTLGLTATAMGHGVFTVRLRPSETPAYPIEVKLEEEERRESGNGDIR